MSTDLTNQVSCIFFIAKTQEMPRNQRTSVVFVLIAMGFCEVQRPVRDFHKRTGMLLNSHH